MFVCLFLLPQKQFCSPPSTQHKAYQRDLNSTYNQNLLRTSVHMKSPLKQGAVCPECFIVLGDTSCIWNSHVYTVLWNRDVYAALTTLLLCIPGRFYSLLLCPSGFFHAAYCERSHQKVLEYFPSFLSYHHSI